MDELQNMLIEDARYKKLYIWFHLYEIYWKKKL